MNEMKQLTREQAIAFGESRAWETMSLDDRAWFQMNQSLLCMPFEAYHEAVEHALGRPVWSHEFGSTGGLRDEMLGIKPRPSMEDIINLIPAEKRMVIEIDGGNDD